MATFISKQRLYRKYAGFPKSYRIIHLETSADVVLRTDHETSIEESMSSVEKGLDNVTSCFDENGVLKPECGGTGVGTGNPSWSGPGGDPSDGGGDDSDNKNKEIFQDMLDKMYDSCEKADDLDEEDSVIIRKGDTGEFVHVSLNDLISFIAGKIDLSTYIKSGSVQRIEYEKI